MSDDWKEVETHYTLTNRSDRDYVSCPGQIIGIGRLPGMERKGLITGWRYYSDGNSGGNPFTDSYAPAKDTTFIVVEVDGTVHEYVGLPPGKLQLDHLNDDEFIDMFVETEDYFVGTSRSYYVSTDRGVGLRSPAQTSASLEHNQTANFNTASSRDEMIFVRIYEAPDVIMENPIYVDPSTGTKTYLSPPPSCAYSIWKRTWSAEELPSILDINDDGHLDIQFWAMCHGEATQINAYGDGAGFFLIEYDDLNLVSPMGPAPQAIPDAYQVASRGSAVDRTIVLDPLANDLHASSAGVVSVSRPSDGQLWRVPGTFTYRYTASYRGTDEVLTYTISDDYGQTSSATITIEAVK